MRRPISLHVTICAVALLAATSRAEEPKAIEPADAKNHLREKVVVTFEVKGAKTTSTGRVFLDSEENFKDAKNLGIAISAGTAKKFTEQGIADPAAYFRGKKIRVTGEITIFESRHYLNVSDPKQIVVLEK